MTAIGVLCARVRMEEKQIIAALADAGVVAMPVPPASTPLPPGPASAAGTALGNYRHDGDHVAHHQALDGLIDRCQNRHVAAATLPLLKLGGTQMIDAGLAAIGTRIVVATALAQAGLPRPQEFVGFSEASAMAAAARLGFPSTLMPQTPGSASTLLLDHDTAEAVIEHRVVLGSHGEAIVLLQAGAPDTGQIGRHHVIGGEVVAVEGVLVDERARNLASKAAEAIGALCVTVDIARVDGQVVIWDIVPVTDFRHATLTGPRGVGQALADLARSGRDGPVPAHNRDQGSVSVVQQGWEVQVKHGAPGVSLTA